MSRSGGRDEFYVGYEPAAPAGIALRVRFAVAALIATAGLVAVLLAAAQRPLGLGRFEFGSQRVFHGVVRSEPYPVLLVPRPGSETFSAYLLTVFGKSGAAAAVQDWEGRAVTLRGTLIHRADRVMVEVASGGIEPWTGTGAAKARASAEGDEVELGTMAITGEIVDSKCFLGVMKPGDWKPHRACAQRCISGGVPPLLVERGPGAEQFRHFVLVGMDGEPVNRRVLDRVAVPVRVTGRVTLRDGALVMHADPDTFEPTGFTLIRPEAGAVQGAGS